MTGQVTWWVRWGSSLQGFFFSCDVDSWSSFDVDWWLSFDVGRWFWILQASSLRKMLPWVSLSDVHGIPSAIVKSIVVDSLGLFCSDIGNSNEFSSSSVCFEAQYGAEQTQFTRLPTVKITVTKYMISTFNSNNLNSIFEITKHQEKILSCASFSFNYHNKRLQISRVSVMLIRILVSNTREVHSVINWSDNRSEMSFTHHHS